MAHHTLWTRLPEYVLWVQIKQRTGNSNDRSFPSYGGRGIRMHPPWAKSYEEFFAYIGRRPSPRHSLDRKDNDGHYEPGNVRWATPVEQSRNKRNNNLLTAYGKTQTITEWASELGIYWGTIASRLKSGRTVEQALVPHDFRKRGFGCGGRE